MSLTLTDWSPGRFSEVSIETPLACIGTNLLVKLVSHKGMRLSVSRSKQRRIQEFNILTMQSFYGGL